MAAGISQLEPYLQQIRELEFVKDIQFAAEQTPCAGDEIDGLLCATKATTGNLGGSHASPKMRVGPSEPACRSRFQTASSCIGQEPLW